MLLYMVAADQLLWAFGCTRSRTTIMPEQSVLTEWFSPYGTPNELISSTTMKNQMVLYFSKNYIIIVIAKLVVQKQKGTDNFHRKLINYWMNRPNPKYFWNSPQCYVNDFKQLHAAYCYAHGEISHFHDII